MSYQSFLSDRLLERLDTPTPPSNSQAPSEGAIAAAPVQAQRKWEIIASESFEDGFPSADWAVQDLIADGYERKWDDDDYRPFAGSWAAWPANGGADGIDPAQGNHDYPNNMDTRMIYGPFDLSDAVQADMWFYMWRQTESNYDYIVFEISHDGIAFQELARWSGDADWEPQDIDYDDHVGDDSVWVAWRFSNEE